MVPTVALPPTVPFTDHCMALLKEPAPSTEAEIVTPMPLRTGADSGVMATAVMDAVIGDGDVVCPPPPPPQAVVNRKARVAAVRTNLFTKERMNEGIESQ